VDIEVVAENTVQMGLTGTMPYSEHALRSFVSGTSEKVNPSLSTQ
jgi:hypothetical protein